MVSSGLKTIDNDLYYHDEHLETDIKVCPYVKDLKIVVHDKTINITHPDHKFINIDFQILDIKRHKNVLTTKQIETLSNKYNKSSYEREQAGTVPYGKRRINTIYSCDDQDVKDIILSCKRDCFDISGSDFVYYESGGRFDVHLDANSINTNSYSEYTYIIYLTDGKTAFFNKNKTPYTTVEAKAGDIVFFHQSIYHAGVQTDKPKHIIQGALLKRYERPFTYFDIFKMVYSMKIRDVCNLLIELYKTRDIDSDHIKSALDIDNQLAKYIHSKIIS